MPNYGVTANPAIRKIGPVTDADLPAIRESLGRGVSVNATARALGLSSNQITNAKKKYGLTSVPAADTTAAVEAFSSKARRNRMATYDRMARIDELVGGGLLKVLEGNAPHSTILRGMGGTESMELVDAVPARDLREIITSLVQNRLAMAKIEDKEEDGGQTRALSVLEQFTHAINQAAGALPEAREGLIQQ